MDSQIIRNMSAVRAGWSEDERRVRKNLAETMQLQLRTLVVLCELGFNSKKDERKQRVPVPVPVASDC